MTTIEEYIKSKCDDHVLRSHLLGIIKKHMSLDLDRDTELDNSDLGKLWNSFTEYTGVVSHAEKVHGRRVVKLAQYVDSAIESWNIQKGRRA